MADAGYYLTHEIPGKLSLRCGLLRGRRRHQVGHVLQLLAVPAQGFSLVKLLTPEDASRTYKFNKNHIQHRFCPTCGIHPYAEGTDGKGNHIAAVNIRCLEGVELESIPVTFTDGRSR